MAKKSKDPRTLTCQRTGRTFVYAGVGRPPKYHPDIQEAVRKEQRSNAQKAKRNAAGAKRKASIAEAAAA